MSLRGDEAVSEVVGYVLIAVIVVISLSWLAAVALPLITEVQEDTAFTRGQNDLASLQQAMEEVARGSIIGTGAERTQYVALGEGVDINVDNSTGSFRVEFSTSSEPLTGIVRNTNTTGDPVQGATVSVEGRRNSDTTGANGAYSVTLPTGAEYDVRVARKGFVTNTTTTTFNPGDTLDVVLDVSNGTLRTRVKNSSTWLQGVTVTVNGTPYSYDATDRATETYEATNTTGSSGWANITGVPTGENYTVTFEKPWYVTEERTGVTVSEDGITGLNVTMQRAGRVQIRVKDATGNISGATVTAHNFTVPVALTNNTNATGDTTIYRVPTGTHTLVATADGHLPNATPISVSFQTNTTQTIHLNTTGTTWTLSGQVRDSIDASYGIETSWVNYTYNSTDVVAATNDTGQFTLPVVAGTHTFTANATDYAPSTADLTMDQNRSQNFSLALNTVPFLHGYVNDTATNISGVDVEIRGETDAGWTFTGTDETDADGHYNITRITTGPYTVDGVPPGNHTIEAVEPGYDTRTGRINLTTDDSYHNISLSQSSDVTLDGTVTSADGGTVSGVNVTVLDGSYSDVTDDSGQYSITLPAGTYDLKAEKTGYLPAYAYDADLSTSNTVNFTVELTLTPGSIHLQSSGRDAWLENDLLARGNDNRSAALRNNFIRVINSSGDILVSTHVVTIDQGSFGQGGGAAEIRISFVEFNEIYSQSADNVTLTIESPVHGAWMRFFRDKLTRAGLTEGNGFTIEDPAATGEADTIRVKIEGGASANDVELRVHETRLKLEGR